MLKRVLAVSAVAVMMLAAPGAGARERDSSPVEKGKGRPAGVMFSNVADVVTSQD